MREQVAIVLNEREPLKQKMAERLERRFRDTGITSFRYPIDADLVRRLTDRRPPLIITDYLLGDHATGLDILTAFADDDEALRPACIMFTDEPSISVAVEAMRLGALNFYQIDQLDSFEALFTSVRATLHVPARTPGLSKQKGAPLRQIDDLTALSPRTRAVQQRLRLLSRTHPQALLIAGPRGSGRSTVARVTANALLQSYVELHLDYRLFSGHEAELKAALHPPGLERAPGRNVHLIVDHVDESPAPVLECAQWLERMGQRTPATGTHALLTVITSRPEICTAWDTFGLQSQLTLPALDERLDDLPMLVQSFVAEGSALLNLRKKSSESEISKWAAGRRWPQNLTQLRTVILEALAGDEEIALLTRLEAAVGYWAETATAQPHETLRSRAAAMAALEASDFDYRCAAALLGWSVRGVREAVSATGRLH